MSMTSSTESAEEASTTWVAPNSRAASSRLAIRSIAMMVVHPVTCAASSAADPTAPAPKIAKDDPAGGARELSTAPAPVWMPQPSGPRISSGTSASTRTTEPDGYVSGSFGPTTAGRMDSYVEQFQAAGGSLIMLAKANRSASVARSCKRHGGFYLGTIGGPAARIAQDCITDVRVIDFDDLGMEAVWRIEVRDFPAFVVTNDRGEDFFAPDPDVLVTLNSFRPRDQRGSSVNL